MDMIEEFEPVDVTIFELIGMGIFILMMFLSQNFPTSLMSMFLVLSLMMIYSYFKKGKTRLWKKIKV